MALVGSSAESLVSSVDVLAAAVGLTLLTAVNVAVGEAAAAEKSGAASLVNSCEAEGELDADTEAGAVGAGTLAGAQADTANIVAVATPSRESFMHEA